MPLNVLISGAGVAGPALALLLLRSNPDHKVTVVERFAALRTGGQQIDLRSHGIPIVKKLGLFEAVRSRTVAEGGVAFIDAQGRRKAVFGVNDSGRGAQSFTSEFEIMRGDLVDVFYQESQAVALESKTRTETGGLKYEFGKYVTELKQDDGSGVHVVFSDGETGRYDLVIGADGQGSRTRRMAFGNEASEKAFKSLGLFLCYYTIPRADDDDDLAKVYQMPEYRAVYTRAADRPVAQAYLATLQDNEELRRSTHNSVEEQKVMWAKLFDDCNWQRDRILDGLKTTTDFYAQQVGQIKLPQWFKGRVALVGDAGYCPSPITGMGTSVSLVGSYVLVGELARHGDDVDAALEAYDKVLRPFVTEAQKTAPGLPGLLFPKTQWGIWWLQFVLGVLSLLRIDKVIALLQTENKGGWKLPEYPELELDD